MSRSFSAALRRAARLMRPPKRSKAARNLNKSFADLIVSTALAAAKPAAAKARTASSTRSLQAMVRRLSAAQALMPGAARTNARALVPRTPKGAQYLTRTHRCAAGSRSYKLYLPASQPKRPKGLIVMLHGCTQTPDDFAAGTRMNAVAEKQGIAVAYPEQAKRHNGGACWNWFRPSNQRRGAGEPAILASLTRKLARDFGLGREATFVAGLSAGGAMASILADVYPETYSAAGIHSGLARGSAHDMKSALSVMRRGGASGDAPPNAGRKALAVRRIIFQGSADSTVHPSNAAALVAAAVCPDAVPDRIGTRSAGGRRYTRSDFAGSGAAILVQLWMIEGAGHAWSGGRAAGSFTDPKGPNASALMMRFFLANSY